VIEFGPIDSYKGSVLNCAAVTTRGKGLRLAMRVFQCAIVCLSRVVLSGRTGRSCAVVLGLREIAIIGDSLESEAEGGAVFRLSLRLATVHQE
jgi:hypothetical protein